MHEPIALIDDSQIVDLYPFTFSRSSASIRWGICTIQEKWEHELGQAVAVKTLPHLQNLYPLTVPANHVQVNARLLPNSKLIEAIDSCANNTCYYLGDQFLFGKPVDSESIQVQWDGPAEMLRYPWEIFQHNAREIQADFERITRNQTSQLVDESNRKIGNHPIFIAAGATVLCSTLNASEGPIYIAAGAEVQEGCMIRGPFSLGEHSQLKMGTRIYSGTTIGPHCKVGGEINNSVIFGYSNKAHEGFLGNSVIGEWCNLGADTNNSNLKNNYEIVKVWSFGQQKFVSTGLQFCGLLMGDHSKSGINTMFNTGTVVGFSCNIFGAGFPRTIIPSFSWGGASAMSTYQLSKAMQTAKLVFARRNKAFDATQESIFTHLFNQTHTHD